MDDRRPWPPVTMEYRNYGEMYDCHSGICGDAEEIYVLLVLSCHWRSVEDKTSTLYLNLSNDIKDSNVSYKKYSFYFHFSQL